MGLRPPELGLKLTRIGAAMSAFRMPLIPPLVLSARHRCTSSASAEVVPVALTGDMTVPELPTTSQSPHFDAKGGPASAVMPEKWKVVSSKELGIKNSMISKPTRSVLNGLKKKGYDVYLVGGCVRDLIMKRIPKDFDIITTAQLSEVKRIFARCNIIGKRFPICHVYVNDYTVEVSSFHTSARKLNESTSRSTSKPDCKDDDYARWKNCTARDFTINGLMFNPFSHEVYDYIGGMDDLKKAKLRTVIPARTSFQEDCARILRAIRIAARLGLSFSRETAYSIKDLASSVLTLDKGRILMELNYMLAYGSAEASLRMLWKFGILELLMPVQAAYFVSRGFKRRDQRTNMLLALFSNMDRLLAPNKPCHHCLWIAVLAFHEALARQPRQPLAVAVYALALHNGGDLSEVVGMAKKITHRPETNFPELLPPQNLEEDEDLIAEVLDLARSVDRALSSITDEHFIAKAMSQYPQAPHSDLVFISLQAYLKVRRMFDCIHSDRREKCFIPKQGTRINYFNLAHGSLAELRHVFARIIFDTVFPTGHRR